MSSPILTGKALRKTFGDTVALDGVSISLAQGQVTAIVGENGAGKSTLAKLLAGLLAPDEGSIVVAGSPASWRSRREAVAAGIGFVPQSLSFITTLSLAENHLIGGTRLRTDRRQAALALAAACRELGMELPLDQPLDRFSLPQRQLAEIASAVAGGARVLLLDEPTSSLGPSEIDNLVAALRRLAQSGTAIGLVTHRITEVLNGADHVSVLRGGRPIFDGPTQGLSTDRIAHFMVGATVPPAKRPAPAREDIRISAERISLKENGVSILQNVTLAVRAGEIVGVAGMAGASQNALADILAGLKRPTSGRLLAGGRDIAAVAGLRNGVAHIPQERAAGVVPDLTVAENASLLQSRERRFSRFGLRRGKAEHDCGARIAEAWDVRPRRPDLAAGALSGGNQQKLLVGRELDRKPDVIIAHGPTQGLDLAAAAAIRGRLVEAAANGAAVVVLSSDLDEILAISHRVIVLSAGRVADVLEIADGPVDMIRLGRAIGGTTPGAADESRFSPPAVLDEEVA